MDLMLTWASPCGDVGMVHFACEKDMNLRVPESGLPDYTSKAYPPSTTEGDLASIRITGM